MAATRSVTSRSGSPSRTDIVTGTLLTGGAFLSLMTGISLAGGLFLGQVSYWMAPVIILDVILGVKVTLLANRILRRGGRAVARTLSSIDELDDGPILLYLRPFGLDVELDRGQPLPSLMNAIRAIVKIEKSEEQHIGEAIARCQDRPMVAAARPGERHPQFSTIWVRLTEQTWQAQVRELLQRSERVVLVTGVSRGTMWELAECMRELQPEQLVLIVTMDKTEYNQFRRDAEEYISKYLTDLGIERASRPQALLPAYVEPDRVRTRVKGLIHFDPDWLPRFYPLRRYSSVYSSLRGMLLHAFSSIDTRTSHCGMAKPSGTLQAAGVLALTGSAIRLANDVAGKTAEEFFLGFVETAALLCSTASVGLYLLYGARACHLVAVLYFTATLWWNVFVDRTSFLFALESRDLLFIIPNLLMPALIVTFLLPYAAKRRRGAT